MLKFNSLFRREGGRNSIEPYGQEEKTLGIIRDI